MENIKPDKVEGTLPVVEAAEPKPLSTSEQETSLINKTLDQCAGLLENYRPKFVAGVDKMSSNQLRRLLKTLVEYPINDRPYNPKDGEEKAVFMLGTRILEAKHTLIMYTMFGEALKQSTSKVAEVAAPEVVTEVKENNNG